MSQLILQGLGGPMIVCQGYGDSGPTPGAQTFRQALVSKVDAIPELVAIVGNAIYPGSIPQTHDLGRDGPALTYTILTNPRGHVLSGADGTATARVQFSAWAYQLSDADGTTLAVWNALDGIPDAWGNGTCRILSVTHQDEQDNHSPPRTGRDQWLYRIDSEYAVKYRTGFPTLS